MEFFKNSTRACVWEYFRFHLFYWCLGPSHISRLPVVYSHRVTCRRTDAYSHNAAICKARHLCKNSVCRLCMLSLLLLPHFPGKTNNIFRLSRFHNASISPKSIGLPSPLVPGSLGPWVLVSKCAFSGAVLLVERFDSCGVCLETLFPGIPLDVSSNKTPQKLLIMRCPMKSRHFEHKNAIKLGSTEKTEGTERNFSANWQLINLPMSWG